MERYTPDPPPASPRGYITSLFEAMRDDFAAGSVTPVNYDDAPVLAPYWCAYFEGAHSPYTAALAPDAAWPEGVLHETDWILTMQRGLAQNALRGHTLELRINGDAFPTRWPRNCELPPRPPSAVAWWRRHPDGCLPEPSPGRFNQGWS